MAALNAEHSKELAWAGIFSLLRVIFFPVLCRSKATERAVRALLEVLVA
jgi:hypothetical protein